MNGLILMDVASAQSCQGAGFVGMVCCCPAAAPRSGCIDFFAFVIVRGLKPPGYTPPPLPGHLRIPRPAGAKVIRLRPAGAFAYPPSRRGKGYTPPPLPGHLRIPRPEGTKVIRLRPCRGICVSPRPAGAKVIRLRPAGAFAYPPVPKGHSNVAGVF